MLAGAAYLLGLGPLGVGGARTLALVAWLVGHAALGVVMGWERRPIRPRDLLANPSMVVWAACAVAFGAGRLLYASAFPRFDPRLELLRVSWAPNLRDQDQAAILGGNATKLLLS